MSGHRYKNKITISRNLLASKTTFKGKMYAFFGNLQKWNTAQQPGSLAGCYTLGDSKLNFKYILPLFTNNGTTSTHLCMTKGPIKRFYLE